MQLSRSMLFSSALVAMAAPLSFGQHRGDIILTLSDAPDVSIVTNRFTLDGVLTPGVRVFPARLGDFGPNTTDNPGFDCSPGTFPSPSSNGFRIRRALRVWNGADFGTIPEEQIAIAFNILG